MATPHLRAAGPPLPGRPMESFLFTIRRTINRFDVVFVVVVLVCIVVLFTIVVFEIVVIVFVVVVLVLVIIVVEFVLRAC